MSYNKLKVIVTCCVKTVFISSILQAYEINHFDALLNEEIAVFNFVALSFSMELFYASIFLES